MLLTADYKQLQVQFYSCSRSSSSSSSKKDVVQRLSPGVLTCTEAVSWLQMHAAEAGTSLDRHPAGDTLVGRHLVMKQAFALTVTGKQRL
jgi:hypothetical protein